MSTAKTVVCGTSALWMKRFNVAFLEHLSTRSRYPIRMIALSNAGLTPGAHPLIDTAA